MPMPSYPIYCYTRGCKNKAVYKIAAKWSDGVQNELKTYGLCCEQCVEAWFRNSREKQRHCRLAPGEILEPTSIFRMERGERDVGLERLNDLERHFEEEIH